MNKLNKKGVTLVELIVSFAIVGVAIIYFFQTLYTVKTIYQTAQNQTDIFVAKDYGLRIIDEYLNDNSDNRTSIDSENNYFMVYYDGDPQLHDIVSKNTSNPCGNKESVIVPYYSYYNYNINKYDVLVCY